MRLTLEIDMNGAAFDTVNEYQEEQGPDGSEVALILRKMARKVDGERLDLTASGTLLDSNGNAVGEWEVQ